MAATLEYGLYKDGRMLHITEVENGLKCGCVCPNPLCGQRLIARNNPSNTIALNFAHESGAECAGAKESELHKRAKQIICDHRRIRLPDLTTYSYESAVPEKNIDKFRADVSLHGKSTVLLVEIVVTCDLSDEKTFFLRQSGKRVLIIDLTRCPRDLKKEDLARILIEDYEDKSMIEPLPVKSVSSGDKDWSVEKIWGIVILVAGLFWATPRFFKSIGSLFGRKKKRRR